MSFFLLGRSVDNVLTLLSDAPFDSRQDALAELGRITARATFDRWDDEVLLLDLESGTQVLLVRPAVPAGEPGPVAEPIAVPEAAAFAAIADEIPVNIDVVAEVEALLEEVPAAEPMAEVSVDVEPAEAPVTLPTAEDTEMDELRAAIERTTEHMEAAGIVAPESISAAPKSAEPEAEAAPTEETGAPVSEPEEVAIDTDVESLLIDIARPEPEVAPVAEVTPEPEAAPVAEVASEPEVTTEAEAGPEPEVTTEAAITPEAEAEPEPAPDTFAEETPEAEPTEAAAPSGSDSEPEVAEPAEPAAPAWPWDTSAELSAVTSADLAEADSEEVFVMEGLEDAALGDEGSLIAGSLDDAALAATRPVILGAYDVADVVLSVDEDEVPTAVEETVTEPVVEAVVADESTPEGTIWPAEDSDFIVLDDVPATDASITSESAEVAPADTPPLSSYTCDDCVYVDTCPNKDQRHPQDCGSFQWK